MQRVTPLHLHNRPQGDTLISQIRKLRLGEGACPGLHPTTQWFEEAAGPREVRKRSGVRDWGSARAPEATSMPLDPDPDLDPDRRVLAGLVESRAGQAAHGHSGLQP